MNHVLVCPIIPGRPSKLFDDCNPDWVPTLHLGYELKQASAKRYDRRKARSARQVPCAGKAASCFPSNLPSGAKMMF